MLVRIPEIFLGALLAIAIFALGFSVMSSLSPPHDRQEQQQGQNSGAKKTQQIVKTENADDRIALYTLWLAILTGCLVIVAGVQGYFLLRADKTARISADTAAKSVKLARDEFVSSHPPKVIVRDILLWQNSTFEKIASGEFPVFYEGEKLQGHLTMLNVGGSKASIEFAYRMVYWTQQQLPIKPPYAAVTIPILDPPIVLEPGQGTQISPISCKKPLGQEAASVSARQGGWKLYVLGFIRYRDDLRIVRHMKFCREWLPEEARFRAVDHPDYESEY